MLEHLVLFEKIIEICISKCCNLASYFHAVHFLPTVYIINKTLYLMSAQLDHL